MAGNSKLRFIDANSKLTISADDPCWSAYWALGNGDIGPAIALLYEGTALHPLLQRELARMLDGTNKRFELRLASKRRGRPPRAQHETARRDRKIWVDWLEARRADPLGAQKPMIGKMAVKYGLCDREIYDAIERVEARLSRLKRFMDAHRADDSDI